MIQFNYHYDIECMTLSASLETTMTYRSLIVFFCFSAVGIATAAGRRGSPKKRPAARVAGPTEKTHLYRYSLDLVPKIAQPRAIRFSEALLISINLRIHITQAEQYLSLVSCKVDKHLRHDFALRNQPRDRGNACTLYVLSLSPDIPFNRLRLSLSLRA